MVGNCLATCCEDPDPASCTTTPKPDVPAGPVAVPLSIPLELKLNPLGGAPLWDAHVSGGVAVIPGWPILVPNVNE